MDPDFIIRPLSSDDIGDCVSLSASVSWNQTENDWKHITDDPLNVCLGAASEEKIIGTAAAITYENDIAWIGMVLVEKSFRGRGISKILLSDLLDRLKSFRSVKLDATPAGQPVYAKFGFIEECTIYRMTRPGFRGFRVQPQALIPEHITPGAANDIVDFDKSVFGAGREKLIKYLIEKTPDKAWLLKENDKITGFVLSRPGRNYHQVGPVAALSFEGARALISRVLEELDNIPVVVDVPAVQEELIEWLKFTGFENQRHFVRMYLETNPFPGQPENQFLICGPEFG
jgi:GNAT superfamily N-acetyltransferase